MKPFFYFVFLAVAACGTKHSSVDYGKTTVAELMAAKGRPLEEKSIPVENGKLLLYEDNQKFQVEDNVVTHGFKDPKGDEQTVLYWKHKFRDCKTSIRKISKPQGHELPEFELKCSEQGITVIYTDGSDFVSRIIEHEKQ